MQQCLFTLCERYLVEVCCARVHTDLHVDAVVNDGGIREENQGHDRDLHLIVIEQTVGCV